MALHWLFPYPEMALIWAVSLSYLTAMQVAALSTTLALREQLRNALTAPAERRAARASDQRRAGRGAQASGSG